MVLALRAAVLAVMVLLVLPVPLVPLVTGLLALPGPDLPSLRLTLLLRPRATALLPQRPVHPVHLVHPDLSHQVVV